MWFGGGSSERSNEVADIVKRLDVPYWAPGSNQERPGESVGICIAYLALDTWRQVPPRVDGTTSPPTLREDVPRRAWTAKAKKQQQAATNRLAANQRQIDEYVRLSQALKLDKQDSELLKEMRKCDEGDLAYLAAAIATNIYHRPAWRHSVLDERVARVNLEDEVVSIVQSARTTADARRRLGPPPSGHLSEDDQIAAMYASKSELMRRRVESLRTRVEAFQRYHDGLAQIDRQLEKLAWIEGSGAADDLDHFVAQAGDDLSKSDLERTAETVTTVVSAIVDSMVVDATRMSRG
ncbi:hypothetical protein [Microbispora sp. NRRL B-24597]|uniref:hypothetical protein n=1 Tax=Microbispora sp. NRRL B-24597 TaxID=1463823 RepID=UPI0012DEDB76|nr:hypothetical protein [Microbispora sp. NRRL B-24597]